jgi:hypothetical protein
VSEAPAVARRPAEDVSSVRPGSRQVLIVPPGRMAPRCSFVHEDAARM